MKKNFQTILLWALKMFGEILYWFGRPVYLILSWMLTNIPPLIGDSLLKTLKVGIQGEKNLQRFLKRKFKKEKKSILATRKKVQQWFRKIKLPKLPSPQPGINFLIKRKIAIAFLVLCSVLLVNIYLIYTFFQSLPSPLTLRTRDIILTTKIYDQSGQILYKIYKNQNRTLVSLNQIPPSLKQATIAIEDKDFYRHGPLSPRGIIRALRQNMQGDFQGGSTITQQLIKNALLSPERTIERKIKEIVLAFETELTFTKDEILTMYFNEVGYGSTAYGIEEAAQLYFGKSVEALDLAESALLAGLPAAPTFFSPFGAYPENAKKRQEEVLRRMREDGYITRDQEQKAKSQELVFAPQRTNIKAPHFVMYVKDLLVQKYGEKLVEQGGLSVTTTLDLKVQEMVQKEVTEGVDRQQYLNVGNGAALVTKPDTGEVLAMVGSRDYFDTERDGNVNVVLMSRQPGSAIKPVNYAAALSLGKVTLTTVIPDTPIGYRIAGQPLYVPQNYDGRFHGRVTVRTALGSSLNVPAVKILSSYGVDEMINMGEKLGITTWGDRSRFGLSLTLGGGEIKMIDMNTVFATFANEGIRVNPNPILKVVNAKNKVLEENIPQKVEDNRVLSQGIAFLLTSILSDNNARSMVFGPNSPLVIPTHTVAVKTGTTETKKDNWTIGYTKDYVVSVWIGNNDSSPMSWFLESGYTGAAPIWHNIMVSLLKEVKDQPLSIPDDIVQIQICKVNGLLPCDGCPTAPEYFVKGTEPKIACVPRRTEEEARNSDPPPPTPTFQIIAQEVNNPLPTQEPPGRKTKKNPHR